MRNYDPQTGQWVQQDPLQEFSSPYTGIGNDPVDLSDPSGGGVFGEVSLVNKIVAGTLSGAIIGGTFFDSDNGIKGAGIGAAIGLLGVIGGSLGTHVAVRIALESANAATIVINTSANSQQAGMAQAGLNFNANFNKGGLMSVHNYGYWEGIGGGPGDGKGKGKKKMGWDSNGDGKMQKGEADNHYMNGGGTPITVNGNKIDLSGLEAKDMTYDSKKKIYSLSTTKAFKVLPWETAATYGGSIFKLVNGKWQMQSQDYHYKMRPWSSGENVIRNVLTIFGDPENTLRPSEMNNLHGQTAPFGKSYLINITY